jgi:hypothetical protein
MNSRTTLILSLSAVVLFACVVGLRAQAHLVLSADPEGQMCPLPESQQVEAPKAFAEMAPIFHNPRCEGCHGGVDPYADEKIGKHGGGKIPRVMHTVSEDDMLTGKMVERVEEDVAATRAKCESCHSAFTPWMLPPAEMNFAGKDTVTLCKQMKRIFSGDADLFIGHINNENGGPQFIEEAFKGTRGLGPGGIDFFEGDTGTKFKLEPPPSTHAQLLALAKKWVDRMGGKFQGNSDCGCVPQHYALEIKEKLNSHESSGAGNSQVSGEANAQVRLTFNPDSSFTGTGSAERQIKASGNDEYTACKLDLKVPVTFVASGSLNEKDNKLHIKVNFSNPETQGRMTCAGRTMSMPVRAWDSRSVSHPLNNFDLTANIGEEKSFSIRIPDSPGTENITVRIVKLP